MHNKKAGSLRNMAIVILSLFFISYLALDRVAFAHTFSDYESAAFLAKIPEVKVETNMIATHAGDKEAISYYVNILDKYWTPKDRSDLNERNPQLANLISSAINDTIAQAKAGNEDKAYSGYFSVAGYMEQAGLVRVDRVQSNNATIQAMSVALVVKESLDRYGEAIGSPHPDTSTIKTSNTTTDSATDGEAKIVNKYAYENAKALANEGVQMFGQVITYNDDKQAYNNKVINYLTKYTEDLNKKADSAAVVSDVYMGVMPNLVSGYKMSLQSVPEFPFPSVVVISVIVLMIVFTRLGPSRK